MSRAIAHESAVAQLVAFVNGTLSAPRRAEVAAHLAGCPQCRREVAAWRALSAAAGLSARAAVLAPPAESILAAVSAAAGPAAAGTPAQRAAAAGEGRAFRHLAAVLAAQIAVVRRSIWAASALVLVIGAIVVASTSVDAGRLFALLAPLMAACGVSLVCGASLDPRLEIAIAAPTSPRLVLLARLVLVFAFDLGLVAGASALLVLAGAGGGLWSLVGAWFGPMLLLTSVSLVLAVLTRRPALGVTVGFGLWALRVVSFVPGRPPLGDDSTQLLASMWSTTWPTTMAAVALLAVAVAATRPQARA